jgi:hypothetical protein
MLLIHGLISFFLNKRVTTGKTKQKPHTPRQPRVKQARKTIQEKNTWAKITKFALSRVSSFWFLVFVYVCVCIDGVFCAGLVGLIVFLQNLIGKRERERERERVSR